jgi:16S rRNA (guanine1207-N2)-methyltransferase
VPRLPAATISNGFAAGGNPTRPLPGIYRAPSHSRRGRNLALMGQGQYFDNQPNVRSHPRTVRLALPDGVVDLLTDSGVFSARQVDPGTSVLLRHLGEVSPGDLLDLGCGYGPVAMALASCHPAAVVWAVDVNKRAIELTRHNAAALGLTNIVAAIPTEVPRGQRFAGIWSNPPVRIGKQALHELLTHWLDRLDTVGRARLVVQKYLGSDSLARWLEAEGYPTRRVLSEKTYRVLEVRPRATAR